MTPCWQLVPLVKEKQMDKGLVLSGLEKQAGPKMGLDFRA